jgi:hypothetical protein
MAEQFRAKNFDQAQTEEELILIAPLCLYGNKERGYLLFCNAEITGKVTVDGIEYEYDGEPLTLILHPVE